MEQIEEQFGNKFYDSTINEAKTVLQDTGPGSRGLLAFGKGDEAHIVNVINWHGKVIAIDAQNMTYGTITEVIKNSGYTGSGPMQFMFTHRAR